MQKFKTLFASFFITTISLSSNVGLAQNKPPTFPVVIAAVAPVYTAVARAIRLQGDFRVDVEIDRNGKVTSSKAIEGTHKLMRKVIEEAADRWQFAPDENAGKKRRVQLTFTLRFVPKASIFDSTTVFYPPYKIEVRDNTLMLDTPSQKP